MKVKFIGNFTDGTSWAKNSTYTALKLSKNGYDVYCSEVKYNKSNIVFNNDILDLMSKSSNDYDVIIHNCLPNNYVPNYNSKNIGYFNVRTYGIATKVWTKNISLMDEMLVPDTVSKKALRESGYQKPIKILKASFDKNLPENTIAELPSTFNFGFFGSFSRVKNLENILRAFHTEFNYVESVNIVIKTLAEKSTVERFINDVKNRLKKPKCKREIVISDYVDHTQYYALLNSCHTILAPFYGQSYCYPAIEAMSLGIPVIYNENTGLADYMSNDCQKVTSSLQHCYGDTSSGIFVNACDDLWFEPNVLSIQKAMREAFENYIQSKNQKCKDFVSQLDYNEVMERII